MARHHGVTLSSSVARVSTRSSTSSKDIGARERILQAAAKLLADSGGEPVSTRAVLAEAGVGAPTLYHHFGDKQGLLDAVVAHGFTQYLADRRALPAGADPLDGLRREWDDHVRFGLANPAFYTLMYGSARPGRRPAAADEAQAPLLESLDRAARAGLLRVPPEAAARMVLAANIGVTLTLVTDPEESPDNDLSTRTREAVLAAVAVDPAAGAAPEQTPLPALAISLGAALGQDGAHVLTPGERGLLREWLGRLEA
jgi:AcrR family transcriptional regulator